MGQRIYSREFLTKNAIFYTFSIQFLTANSLAKYDGVCECNIGYEQFVRVARKRDREVLWQFLENWCTDIRRCEVNGAFYNEGYHEDFDMCQTVQCRVQNDHQELKAATGCMSRVADM